ncbi:59_t:CDS:1, partial [Scutellospora calospora]
MFGGDFGTTNITNLVFTYNIKTQIFSNPVTINQPANMYTRSVCDLKTGRMLMFNGTMCILDTKTLTWSV